MFSRYAVPVLCAAAIVFACAPRPHAAVEGSSTDAVSAPRAAMKPDTLHPIATALTTTRDASGVRLTMLVTNRAGKNVELMFPSGQTHDFTVLDATGREVWRWSEDRMYTQALQSRLLHANEDTTFEESWEPTAADHGTFTVVATLRSSTHPAEQRAEIVLP